jgi:hypothetical protein
VKWEEAKLRTKMIIAKKEAPFNDLSHSRCTLAINTKGI